MSLDMAQLRAIFYQECRENLEVLERELLGLDTETADPETINTIFRAAHSIKGAALPLNWVTSRISPMSWKRCWMKSGMASVSWMLDR